MNKSNEKFM